MPGPRTRPEPRISTLILTHAVAGRLFVEERAEDRRQDSTLVALDV
jgi:hypothetical protein